MTKYLLIDTNILIQCCLLELEKGDDLNVLRQLNILLDKESLTLLLPEVVELEFYKSLDKKTEKLKKHIGSYKETIKRDTALDEAVRGDMIKKISECFEERKDNTDEVKKEIEKLFKSKRTIKIPITSTIVVNSIRTGLSGNKPYSDDVKSIVQSDVLIVESAKEYLADKVSYCMYLCSQNTADFANNSKIQDAKERIEVADSIKTSFENIEYYTNLLQLLNDVFKTKFTENSIKEFDNRHSSGVIIRIPTSCGPATQVIKEISDILKSCKHGSRKVSVDLYGTIIQTTFMIDESSAALDNLNARVLEVFERNRIVAENIF